MSRWLFSDVDDTIILWDYDKPEYSHLPDIYIDGTHLKIHTKHVGIIQRAHARGDKVVVWSAAGEEWAQSVVRKVGLVGSVDYILQKPDCLIDDERTLRWLHPNPKWYRP